MGGCLLQATTAVVGIISYNSFAGRSGEWVKFTREYVEDMLASGTTHLCPQWTSPHNNPHMSLMNPTMALAGAEGADEGPPGDQELQDCRLLW